MSMINITELGERLGLSKATLKRHMAQGTLTRGVKMGKRDLVWPLREIEALELARVALWDDSKLMMLVNRLMDRREQEANSAINELFKVNS